MADRSGGMVTSNTKARPAKPRASSNSKMATAMVACNLILTEAEGRNPSKLKNEELKFWLRCRDDPAKGNERKDRKGVKLLLKR